MWQELRKAVTVEGISKWKSLLPVGKQSFNYYLRIFISLALKIPFDSVPVDITLADNGLLVYLLNE